MKLRFSDGGNQPKDKAKTNKLKEATSRNSFNRMARFKKTLRKARRGGGLPSPFVQSKLRRNSSGGGRIGRMLRK